ncbi:hypothetical protein Slin15195_G063050 [Septoria linicola]|uniref:Uncharacterized protein n=1 Tax=Septoria linicola TaxID=215465 RepID=A0A9Q9AWA0_9PEZI|nr:hypothetical protein Slin15195_G063050 [Septoria linicola]
MPTLVSDFVEGETYSYTVVRLRVPAPSSPARPMKFWDTFKSKVEAFMTDEYGVPAYQVTAATSLKISDQYRLTRIMDQLDDYSKGPGGRAPPGARGLMAAVNDVRMYFIKNDKEDSLQTDQLYFVTGSPASAVPGLRTEDNLLICEVSIDPATIGENVLRIDPWDWRAAILEDEEIQEWFRETDAIEDKVDVSTEEYDPWVADTSDVLEQDIAFWRQKKAQRDAARGADQN